MFRRTLEFASAEGASIAAPDRGDVHARMFRAAVLGEVLKLGPKSALRSVNRTESPGLHQDTDTGPRDEELGGRAESCVSTCAGSALRRWMDTSFRAFLANLDLIAAPSEGLHTYVVDGSRYDDPGLARDATNRIRKPLMFARH